MAENKKQPEKKEEMNFFREILNIVPFWKAQMTDWKVTVIRTSLERLGHKLILPYLSLFIVALGASKTQLGWITSVGMLVMGVLGPFVGGWIDRNGARKVYIIEEPIAALLGAGVDISKPNGFMVVDIGGGTADVAVVSFNGIVISESIKVAGNKFDDAIVRYVTQKYKLLIGEKTAENIKKQIANVYDPRGDVTMPIKGRHLLKGLPVTMEISDLDVAEAVAELVMEIIDEIKSVLEVTPPELIGDIHRNGIVLTGGGAMLGGLAEAISQETHVRCYVAEDPLECVARGVAAAFKLSEDLLDGFEKISLYKYK